MLGGGGKTKQKVVVSINLTISFFFFLICKLLFNFRILKFFIKIPVYVKCIPCKTHIYMKTLIIAITQMKDFAVNIAGGGHTILS